MQLITAGESYNDKDGSILADTGVHLITPVPKLTDLPEDVEQKTLAVTCDHLCKIPMIRFAVTENEHEYKCNAFSGMCSRSGRCHQVVLIYTITDTFSGYLSTVTCPEKP